MKKLAFLAALLPTLAYGQGTIGTTPTPPSIMTFTCQFPQVEALAKRLGVEKNKTDGASVVIACDNQRYDFFALLNAFLDRVDKATK